mmetsp:Transcript_56191/g.100031  ORF Transcript_56191/g.100031 Transcript_56191/m.100031 type:complete len:314 (-) Transcript_56191:28-969(-)
MLYGPDLISEVLLAPRFGHLPPLLRPFLLLLPPILEDRLPHGVGAFHLRLEVTDFMPLFDRLGLQAGLVGDCVLESGRGLLSGLLGFHLQVTAPPPLRLLASLHVGPQLLLPELPDHPLLFTPLLCLLQLLLVALLNGVKDGLALFCRLPLVVGSLLRQLLVPPVGFPILAQLLVPVCHYPHQLRCVALEGPSALLLGHADPGALPGASGSWALLEALDHLHHRVQLARPRLLVVLPLDLGQLGGQIRLLEILQLAWHQLHGIDTKFGRCKCPGISVGYHAGFGDHWPGLHGRGSGGPVDRGMRNHQQAPSPG